MPCRLPPELHDRIIDFLHLDEEALYSTALVCKSWLPASRFHLFSNVDFYGYNTPKRLELLCAEKSTIPHYIASLRLYGSQAATICPPNEILLRLPRLSNLRNLKLIHFQWEDIEPDARNNMMEILRNVTTLVLYELDFKLLDDAAKMFFASSSLEKLSLSHVTISSNLYHACQQTFPSLKWLQTDASESPPILLDWLSSRCANSTIHTLTVTKVSIDNIPSVCNLIRQLAPSLENLAIACEALEGTEVALSREIDIAPIISLRNIAFEVHATYDLDGDYHVFSYTWIILILSQITHASLESVTLVARRLDLVKFSELPALEALLMTPIFSNNSTTLCFNALLHHGIEVDDGFEIEDRLRRLHGQGRLAFNLPEFMYYVKF